MKRNDLVPELGANNASAGHLALPVLGEGAGGPQLRVVPLLVRRGFHQSAVSNRNVHHGALNQQVGANGLEERFGHTRGNNPLVAGAFVWAQSFPGADAPAPALFEGGERRHLDVGDHSHDRGRAIQLASRRRVNRAFTIEETGCVFVRNHARNIAQSRTNSQWH